MTSPDHRIEAMTERRLVSPAAPLTQPQINTPLTSTSYAVPPNALHWGCVILRGVGDGEACGFTALP
jgi:hypothetical protein